MDIYPESLFTEIEFDHVRAHVASFAATAHAKNKLLNLAPNYSWGALQTALAQVNEILSIYESGSTVPALSAAEVDEILLRLRVKNAMLEAPDFMQLKDLVVSYNTVYTFFAKQKEITPTLQRHFADTKPNQALPDEIDRVLDRKGEVKSDASKELAEIRRELQKKRATADRIFYKVAKKYEEAGLLGQIHESVHEDRRVLAVNASFKSQAKGIFHSSSAKNSLIFIEPMETIEVNNEITLLLDDERREIIRILKNLSAFCAGFLEDIRQMAHIMRAIDFIHAKARYAYYEKACLPNLSKKPEIHLIQAINPVLRYFNKQKGKGVVALDAQLNADQRMMVISGPNAGGKSLTLKTIGLLQTMLQSGLLVPVNPRSTFGQFESMMADIGDAQSIENELSTYSSKLEKMRHLITYASPKSLVLVDEFGSGSDPELGSALAQVFLEEMNNSGTLGVLTTHYNAIKALAGSLPGVVNASMQFNSETFSPEYLLNIGTPGSSYTFEVAQRVGISARLIKQARAKLDKRTVAIDKLLVDVQGEKNALAEARENMQARLKELSLLKDKQTGKIALLEEKLEKYRTQNQQQSETLNWGKRIENMANSYLKDQSPKKKKEINARFWQLLTERAGIAEAEQVKEVTKENKRKAAKLKKQLALPIAVGDKVKLLQSNQRGQIAEIRKDKYLIALGGNISTWVGRDKFVPGD